jgi:hypothetical protein
MGQLWPETLCPQVMTNHPSNLRMIQTVKKAAQKDSDLMCVGIASAKCAVRYRAYKMEIAFTALRSMW